MSCDGTGQYVVATAYYPQQVRILCTTFRKATYTAELKTVIVWLEPPTLRP